MTWTDDLKRVTLADGRVLIGASFRGVPFLVTGSELAGGRRAVTHEFPKRDDPYVEDLGRRARTFRVDGYLVGDRYVRERDALLAALEEEGPGQLVHPYHGVRRAVCNTFNVRETVQEGRMVVIAIDFSEAPAQGVTPTDQPDLPARVDESSTAAVVATQAELTTSYDVTDLPSAALESAAAALSAASAAVGAALAPVVELTQELARLDRQVQLLTAQASSLVREPDDVLDEFRSAILELAETSAAAPGAVVDALVEAYGFDEGPAVPGTTATREQERANLAALVAALRRILAIEAARLIPFVTFSTLEDAIAARDQIVALLDEQAATASDDAYPALIALRARVSLAVPGDSALARVIVVQRATATPSLLLSYQLYGSTTQEADIVARNTARHPGFMSGALRVLSDA